MTMTDTTPPDLRTLTEDELLDLARSDGTVAAGALAEAGRRDRDDRLARGRRALADIRAEGDRQAYANYRQADKWCRGELLSEDGIRAGITDEQVLWRLPEDKALRFASEELGLFWELVAPRVTSDDYVHQHAAERRKAEDEARNGHDAGTGLAGADPSAFRRRTTASETPQAGGGGTVQRGGRRPGEGEGGQDGAADQRASGPVQRDTVSGCRHPHRIGTPGQCGNCPAKTQARGTGSMGAVARDVAVPVTGVVRSPDGTVARQEQLVPGDQLLDLIRDGYLGFFARFPSPAALDAVTLWAAHTHMRDEKGVLVFRATPRLGLFSSEPGSGKGLVLELLMDIVPNCFGLDLEPTQAGLVHTLNDEHATVLLDEADIMFGAGSRKEGVRAVLNGGTYRYGTILNGRGGKTNRVPVFGPVAVAGLDTMEKDTGDKLTAMWTRFVKIRMVKVTGADKPPRRTPKSYEAVAKAKGWLELWASQVRDEVAAAFPEMPDEDMEGRTEDIWAPLFAVADAAGGDWPSRARAACLELALARPGDTRDLAAEFEEFAASFDAA
jgi:Protein of unknown function (DUF3631)